MERSRSFAIDNANHYQTKVCCTLRSSGALGGKRSPEERRYLPTLLKPQASYSQVK